MDHVCDPEKNSPALIPVRIKVRASTKVAEVVLPDPMVVPLAVVDSVVVLIR